MKTEDFLQSSVEVGFFWNDTEGAFDTLLSVRPEMTPQSELPSKCFAAFQTFERSQMDFHVSLQAVLGSEIFTTAGHGTRKWLHITVDDQMFLQSGPVPEGLVTLGTGVGFFIQMHPYVPPQRRRRGETFATQIARKRFFTCVS